MKEAARRLDVNIKPLRIRNTPRQSVNSSAVLRGTVALIAPKPPATICRPFIKGRRSGGNQRTYALKEAIRQAETPKPMSSLPMISPLRDSAMEKISAPKAAKMSRTDSVLRGPKRSSSKPSGSWKDAKEMK